MQTTKSIDRHALQKFSADHWPWMKLQSGAEKVTRFGPFVEDALKLGINLRKQNGYQHLVSITFLCRLFLFRIGEAANLDKAAIMECCVIHDEPENLLGRDIALKLKTDQHDLEEYLAFEDLHSGLGIDYWKHLQSHYLLPYIRKPSTHLPSHAQEVIRHISRKWQMEALFWDGVERIDYLFYAAECFLCHHEEGCIEEVARRQIPKIEEIASQFPAFKIRIWDRYSDLFKCFVA